MSIASQLGQAPMPVSTSRCRLEPSMLAFSIRECVPQSVQNIWLETQQWLFDLTSSLYMYSYIQLTCICICIWFMKSIAMCFIRVFMSLGLQWKMPVFNEFYNLLVTTIDECYIYNYFFNINGHNYVCLYTDCFLPFDRIQYYRTRFINLCTD